VSAFFCDSSKIKKLCLAENLQTVLIGKIKGNPLENCKNHVVVTIVRNYNLQKKLQTLLVNTRFKAGLNLKF